MQPPNRFDKLTIKWLLILIIAISFIGFLDATYLTIQHYQAGILPCVGFTGCEQVTTSKYATLGNIPIALFGAIYYLIILLSGLIFFDTKKDKVLLVLSYLPIAGFAVSLFLLYLQLFVIHALCTYCVISLSTSTLLFILGLMVLKFKSLN